MGFQLPYQPQLVAPRRISALPIVSPRKHGKNLISTLPETNSFAPENGCLVQTTSFLLGVSPIFRGFQMLVLGSVTP